MKSPALTRLSAWLPHWRPRILVGLFLLAAIGTGARAQIIMDRYGGYLDFWDLPAASELSTLSVAGTAGDVTSEAQMDGEMNSITAAGINSALDQQAAFAANGKAYQQYDYAQAVTQPTGNKMTLMMATLRNETGHNISSLKVAYELGSTVTPTEQIKGHRVYWSTTGAAGSWNAAGTYGRTTAGTGLVEFTVALTGGLGNGGTLYVVWADDNGTGNQGIFTFNYLEFTEPPSTAEMLGMSFPGYGAATIGPLSDYRSFVTLSLPAGTDVTSLSPTYTLADGAVCNIASGTAKDFTDAVEYTVYTADYLESNTYVVLVLVQDPIRVGASGTVGMSFGKAPPTSSWATLSVIGNPGDVNSEAGLDTAMSTIYATSINQSLSTYDGLPMGNAYWRPGQLKLGTEPAGNKMTLLKATLKNVSGGTVGGLALSCELGAAGTPDERIKGYRLYWSLTGLAGSWTAVGSLLKTSSGATTIRQTLEFPQGWSDGETLYVVWADDNGDGTEGVFTLDEVSFTPIEPAANILAFEVGGKAATISGTEIRVVAPPGVDVTRLSPTYTLSHGATCDIPSGSVRDFSNPVLYTVASADSKVSRAYAVTVVSSYWTEGLLAEFFDLSVGSGSLPDFAAMTPDLTRTDAQINYPSTSGSWTGLPPGMADTFGSRHTGAIRIDVAGNYTFYLNSDDGSKFWLDGMLRINNDGLHGMQERSATVNLAPGYYPIRVEFFENDGGAGLIFSWAGPGISRQVVPGHALYTLGSATTSTTTRLTSSLNPSLVGQSVTFTATLMHGGSAATDATGTYAFRRNGSVIAVSPLVNGTATWTTTTLPSGTHPINATYSGDGTYRPSDATISQVNATPVSLEVVHGTGDGIYTPGTVVTIVADLPPVGATFSGWLINAGSPGLADPTSPSTTLTVPSGDVTVTANYRYVAPAGITALAWYDAADAGTITIAEGKVSQWNDKSGNGHHATQADAALRPTAVTGGLQFGGAGVHLILPKMAANAYSVMMVLKNHAAITSSSATQMPLSIQSFSAGPGFGPAVSRYANEVLSMLDEDAAYAYDDRQSASNTKIPSISNVHHQYAFVLGSDWHIGLDGSNDLRDLGNGVRHPLLLSVETGAIGANIRSLPTINQEWSGLVSEIILVSSAITSEQRQQVEGYFAHKWDAINGNSLLVDALPSGHPWKAEAPASNSPPVAIAQGVSASYGTATPITLTGYDADGNDLTFEIVDSPVHGQLTGTLPHLSYTPGFGYSGPDSFTFKVNDGKVDSRPATVSVSVEDGDRYAQWAGPSGHDLVGGPTGDDDGDGKSNFDEFAFGSNPKNAASVDPITRPLDKASHSFRYTRYAFSGLSYTVWISQDLNYWGENPASVRESPGAPDANGVQSVEVTLLAPPQDDHRLFVRVQAE